jgi:hypothetical protein
MKKKMRNLKNLQKTNNNIMKLEEGATRYTDKKLAMNHTHKLYS